MEKYIVKELLHYRNLKRLGCFHISPKPIAFYDLTFVLEGSTTYVVDGVEYVLKKNDAIFIKPGMIRERRESTLPEWYLSFNFDATDGVDIQLPTYLPNSFSADMKKLLQVFPYSYLPLDTYSKQKGATILNFILLDLLEKNARTSQNLYVNKILNIVDEKLTEKLTLQTISNEMNLSKEYVSSLFKKEMGITLTNYINEQKMIVAKEFVINSDMPLVEISRVLSFSNYNYFSKIFKKQFDQTPLSMRNTI